MGCHTFPTHASEVTLAASTPVWGPFGAADQVLLFVCNTGWRWAAPVCTAIPTHMNAPLALSWGFMLVVVAAANEHNADQGAVDVADSVINAAGALEGPVPPNMADIAIPAIKDGPAAETPSMGSLRGILGDKTT